MISEIAIEATPGWLAAAFPPLHEFPLRDILRDSVYYPASGIDGDPVKYLAGNFHSFVLADYGVGRERVLGKLSAFRGYRIAAQREVSERELTPSGWTPQLLQGCKDIPQRRTRRMQPPFGIWSIHERTNEFGSDHGPERFSMLYIGGDGVATFQALYRGNSIAPAVIAIISSPERGSVATGRTSKKRTASSLNRCSPIPAVLPAISCTADGGRQVVPAAVLAELQRVCWRHPWTIAIVEAKPRLILRIRRPARPVTISSGREGGRREFRSGRSRTANKIFPISGGR